MNEKLPALTAKDLIAVLERGGSVGQRIRG